MDKNKNIFNDLSSITKSAFTGAMNMKRDLYNFIVSQVEHMIKKMHFIKREEFNALKKQVSVLKERLDAIAPMPEEPSAHQNKNPTPKKKVAAKKIEKLAKE